MSIHLIITAGKDIGRRITIPKGGCRVGRSTEGNDIVIIDDMLSRHHCRLFFEDDLLHIEDLGSANGTVVDNIEVKKTKLNPGNEIMLGDTVLKVVSNQIDGSVSKPVDEKPADQQAGEKPLVDLGFNSSKAEEKGPASIGKKPLGFLLLVAVLLMLLVWGSKFAKTFNFSNNNDPQPVAVKSSSEINDTLLISYEKIQADDENIFRYYLELDADTNLTVEIDDLMNDRHVTKSVTVDNPEYIQKIIQGIKNSGIYGLDDRYLGLAADSSIASFDLSVTIGLEHKTIKVYNRVEPEEFKQAREDIEEFAKNELGIWAIQFSKDKLLDLAEETYLNAQRLYSEKEVDYGNLYEAIVALKQADWYLETVDPKPDYYPELINLLNDSEIELKQKYDDQNFLAEKAIKVKEWSVAKQELEQIIAMIPNRSDERNIEARRKLVDVKRRIETEQ